MGVAGRAGKESHRIGNGMAKSWLVQFSLYTVGESKSQSGTEPQRVSQVDIKLGLETSFIDSLC